MPTFLEFFAGGGMARAGLGERWECLLANDFSAMKAGVYAANWGASELVVGDIASVQLPKDLQSVDLAWASFPCQDLSLAGNSRGIGVAADENLTRSGTFWDFSRIIRSLDVETARPKIIVLENVVGALSTNKGEDFHKICEEVRSLGYKLGALIIDAVKFVPQSRPRLFIVAVRNDMSIPSKLLSPKANAEWSSARLEVAVLGRPSLSDEWLWWNLPKPVTMPPRFIDIIEDDPSGCEWHSPAQTHALLSMMSETNRQKVQWAVRLGVRTVGTIYKRTRRTTSGERVQRAEVRFDDVAGCLRTPAGGSSRQILLVVERDLIRSRLLSPREAARLMGLPDTYKLPAKYNDAYHVAGDGLCVPAVRHMSQYILEPLVEHNLDLRMKCAA